MLNILVALRAALMATPGNDKLMHGVTFGGRDEHIDACAVEHDSGLRLVDEKVKKSQWLRICPECGQGPGRIRIRPPVGRQEVYAKASRSLISRDAACIVHAWDRAE